VFDLEDELAGLRDRLNEAGIEFALCGGLALGIHGHPRATVDIDILILPADEPHVERIAERLGYTIKARPMSFSNGATEIRRISKVDPADGETLMLDMLLVTPAVEDVWRARQSMQWRGASLGVVSAEGLIALKSLRLSKQDIADIARLRGEE
jgi:Nucleotidyl transferase AbiEii toxin, Type IV TA system